MALLTVMDMERDSKIFRYTWRAWIRQGRIPVRRLGRRVRVSEEDYQKFLDANLKPAREETRSH